MASKILNNGNYSVIETGAMLSSEPLYSTPNKKSQKRSNTKAPVIRNVDEMDSKTYIFEEPTSELPLTGRGT